MTFLDDITSTEKKAQNIRNEAQVKSQKSIDRAHAEQKKALRAAQAEYASKEREKIEEGEHEADTEGSEMAQEGKQMVAILENTVQRKKPEAVQYILNAL